jgi:TP901 family phage tail tape measure protein
MADKQLNIAINIVTKSWQAGMSLMQKGLRLLGSTLNSVFRVGTIAGFFGQIKAGVSSFEGVKKELQEILNTYSDIQSQVKTASAIMTNGGKEATAVYGELLTSLRRISTQSNYTMSDLSKALVTTTRAGLDIPTGETVVQTASKVAFLDDANLNKTTDSIIALRSVFKLTNDEIKNYLAAALTVSNKVKMSTTTLFESIRNSGPAAVSVFKDQKQALIDLIAFTGILQDSNLKASQSGTYARSAIARLNAPTATMVSALAKYSVNLFDASAKGNKFYAVLQALSNETSPLVDKLAELSKQRLKLEASGLTGAAKDYRVALKELKEQKALGEIDDNGYEEGLKTIREMKKAFTSDKQGQTYASLMEEIDTIEEKIKASEIAFSSILSEFRSSGGKLRPLRESLQELMKIAEDNPEVLARVTGVREGQGLTLITQQLKTFLDLVKTGDAALKDGSLLDRMTDVKMGTAKNQFELLKNQVASILSIGPEVFLNSLTPLVKTLTDFLAPIGQAIGTESGSLLDSLITNYLKPFKDSVDSIVSSLKEPLQTLKDLLSPTSQSTSYKKLSVDKQSGDTSVTSIEQATNKASAIFLQLREIILAGANSLTVALAPFLKDLGSLVADSFKVSGKYFVTIIMPVMKEIGQGMWEGFIAHKDEAIKTISDILKEVFTSDAFKDLSTTLQDLFNSIIANIDWSPIGRGAISGLGSVFSNIPKALGLGVTTLKDAFTNALPNTSNYKIEYGTVAPINTNEKKLPSIVEELAMAEKEFLDMVKAGSISLRDKNITSNEKITDAIVEQNKSAEDIKKDLKESFKTETSYRIELANYVKTLTAQTKALNDEIKKAKKDLEKSSETSKKI